MNHIIAKTKARDSILRKYKKILSTDNSIYDFDLTIFSSAVPYDSETLLENEIWYKVENIKSKNFCIEIIKRELSSVDFEMISKEMFSNIDYIYVENDEFLFFQNISKSKLISKKRIIHIGEDFKYDDDCLAITVKDVPDAIYQKENDTLYFKNLSSITGIFKGIDQLYREASEDEVVSFLNNDFISLENGFNSNFVKTANRHRIALAADTLRKLNDNEKHTVFEYIKDYCPNMDFKNNTFKIDSEESLKNLLFGIDQRYYTTLVGGEKRLANSIITLNV